VNREVRHQLIAKFATALSPTIRGEQTASGSAIAHKRVRIWLSRLTAKGSQAN